MVCVHLPLTRQWVKLKRILLLLSAQPLQWYRLTLSLLVKRDVSYKNVRLCTMFHLCTYLHDSNFHILKSNGSSVHPCYKAICLVHITNSQCCPEHNQMTEFWNTNAMQYWRLSQHSRLGWSLLGCDTVSLGEWHGITNQKTLIFKNVVFWGVKSFVCTN